MVRDAFPDEVDVDGDLVALLEVFAVDLPASCALDGRGRATDGNLSDAVYVIEVEAKKAHCEANNFKVQEGDGMGATASSPHSASVSSLTRWAHSGSSTALQTLDDRESSK